MNSHDEESYAGVTDVYTAWYKLAESATSSGTCCCNQILGRRDSDRSSNQHPGFWPPLKAGLVLWIIEANAWRQTRNANTVHSQTMHISAGVFRQSETPVLWKDVPSESQQL